MSIYEELADLYNIEEEIEYNPTLNKTTYIIDNETISGYSFTTPQNKLVFVYRSSSKFHEKGSQMGNPWNLYSITDNKQLITGRKTKKQIIEEAGRF